MASKRKAVSNSVAFEAYRRRRASDLRDEPVDVPIDDWPVLRAITGWFSRYQRRGDAIEGVSGWSDLLADEVLKAAVLARNRARDAAVSTPLPVLTDVPQQSLTFLLKNAHREGRCDVTQPEQAHAYGPSLRALVAGGWDAAFEWGRGAPRAPGAPPPAALCARAVSWAATADLDHPWEASVDGAAWRIRLNDFPDEAPYTLLVDGTAVGELVDWPESWAAPGRAAPKPPRRKAAPPPAIDPARLLPRYEAGEHVAVWNDLVALGPAVREVPFAEPARAVARATMVRVRSNVESIARELSAIGYRFWDDRVKTDSKRDVVAGLVGALESSGVRLPGARALVGWLDGLRAQRPAGGGPAPWVAPAADVSARLDALEREGCVLPLSLRAFIEVVGEVNFCGVHPALAPMEGSPDFRGVYADPLMVDAHPDRIEEALEEAREESARRVRFDFDIGFGPIGKAGLEMDAQVDDLFEIALPSQAADVPLEGTADLTFVGYLRVACANGGFAGWAGRADAPAELAVLTRGLVPF